MQMVGRTADAHVMWIMRKTVLSTSLSPVLECQSDIITSDCQRIETIIMQAVELGRTYECHSGLQN
jgi:hypothetical protein